MKFQDARKKLKKMAKGKYYSIQFGLTEFQSGDIETRCWLYIDSKVSGGGSTFREAFVALEKELGIYEIEKIEEIPDIEA